MVESTVPAWLMAASSPTIRFETLRDLLDRPPGDAEVVAARQAIMTEGPVPAILGRQTDAGHWRGEHSFYTPKYVSTHWSMLLLHELGADPENTAYRRGADYMLTAASAMLAGRLAARNTGWTCLWGNVLRYALPCFGHDDRRSAELLAVVAADVGELCLCPYNGNEPCSWGVLRGLWGLAALPSGERPPEAQKAIDRGVDFLCGEHQLAIADYPTAPGGKIHTIWSRLNFPLFYQADILFALRTLDDLGLRALPGTAQALDWLAGKQSASGQWSGSSPFRTRTWRELGDKEETDRWVTLQAARILRRAGRQALSC